MVLMRRWPLFLIAAPAAVAVWSGWVGLGELSGFGIIHPLPGIIPGFQLNTAITLPVGVEAYGAYALGAWLAPRITRSEQNRTSSQVNGISRPDERARRFARNSAVGALALGMLGQVVFHLLAAAHATRAPWPVVVLVSCMPVVVLGFGAALTHLLRAAADETTDETEGVSSRRNSAPSVPVPVPAAWRLPTHRQVRDTYNCGPETAKKIRAGMAAAVKAASNGKAST
jgi:hypothetical protein